MVDLFKQSDRYEDGFTHKIEAGCIKLEKLVLGLRTNDHLWTCTHKAELKFWAILMF